MFEAIQLSASSSALLDVSKESIWPRLIAEKEYLSLPASACSGTTRGVRYQPLGTRTVACGRLSAGPVAGATVLVGSSVGSSVGVGGVAAELLDGSGLGSALASSF